MKFIGKILLTLLAIIIALVIVAYVIAQTTWGARQISAWVNENTQYRLSLGKIHHDIREPSEVILNNVTLATDGQPPFLRAEKVSLSLGIRQFTDPKHFDSVTLGNGSLSLSAPPKALLPIQAESLRLANMQLQQNDSQQKLDASQVNGYISPWQPTAGQILGNNNQFQFSAGKVLINDVPAQNVLLQGSFKQGLLTINRAGADIAQGQMTSDGVRKADGSWQINNLRLGNIHWQTNKSIDAFFAPLEQLPTVTFGKVSVTDAKLEGAGWALSDLDAELDGITWSKGDWQSEKGTIAFNANDIVVGNVHFVEPIFSADLSNAGVAIRQLSTRWEGSLLRASGNWHRNDKRLTIDDMTIVGLEYTLPQNWREIWQTPLPAWLNDVIVTKFSGSRNLLVDINPEFPFQITALDGFGSNIRLVHNRLLGLWDGQATFNASGATFNKVDLQRLSITLNANDQQIAVSELSALSQKGILEASASLNQTGRQLTLDMKGQAVPANQLVEWGWPALPLSGDVNMQLELQGVLTGEAPLKPSVNATLNVQSASGQQLTQKMVNGVVN
ncbi:MAG: AsmA family protein [Hafnia sp.]